MSGNSTSSANGSTDRATAKCERMIQKSFQSPTVKFLRDQLDKAGCPVKDNFFRAVYCGRNCAAFYVGGEGVLVCSNRVRTQDHVTQAIIHELIHVFDDCRAANLKWTSCAHQACSEIRAGHLSGDCHYKRELLRGFFKLQAHEPECVRRRVLLSLSANPSCRGSVAKDSMEAVWDTCYNDTKPFDKAP